MRIINTLRDASNGPRHNSWSTVTLAVVLSLSAPHLAAAQTSDRSEPKLTDLKSEIASLERQRKTGMYMAAGGAALSLLSLALVPSTTVDEEYPFEVHEGSWAPFYLVLGGGTVLEILGIYKWYNAAQELGPLKAKKYDISLAPIWDDKCGEVGMRFALRF